MDHNHSDNRKMWPAWWFSVSRAVANAMKMLRGVETFLIHINADSMLRIQQTTHRRPAQLNTTGRRCFSNSMCWDHLIIKNPWSISSSQAFFSEETKVAKIWQNHIHFSFLLMDPLSYNSVHSKKQWMASTQNYKKVKYPEQRGSQPFLLCFNPRSNVAVPCSSFRWDGHDGRCGRWAGDFGCLDLAIKRLIFPKPKWWIVISSNLWRLWLQIRSCQT